MPPLEEVQFFPSPDHPTLQELSSAGEIESIHDLFLECLSDLCEIENPQVKPQDPRYEKIWKDFLGQWQKKGSLEEQGVWVYYPWLKKLIHLPEEDLFIRLHTCRNRNLVTEEEQALLNRKRIGIAGMSVGSNVLNTLVTTGVGRHFKIADLDTISVPNLNRIAAPLHAVGLNKAQYFARKAWEVDPFLKIDTFTKGLKEDSFAEYFLNPNLDIFIEEMDNPYLKIQSRNYARDHHIPVIMAADNGDGVLIDVERYDLEPKTPLFNGRLRDLNLDTIQEDMSFSKRLALIARMAGLSEATPRMQDSIHAVGTTLNTWPQLGTAALMAGVTMTFIARRILLGEPMPSGRYKIDLETMVPSERTLSARLRRKAHTKKTMHHFNAFHQALERAEQESTSKNSYPG